MKSVYSVSQVNSYIKNMFTQDFVLNSIYIKGEVSNCKYHTSGHIYFSLKDKGGVISGVMFAGNRGGLNFTLKEGQNVTVKVIGVKDGKISLSMKALTADGEPEEPVEKFDYKETGEATTGLGALLKGLKF